MVKKILQHIRVIVLYPSHKICTAVHLVCLKQTGTLCALGSSMSFFYVCFYDVGVDRIPPYVRKRRVMFQAVMVWGGDALIHGWWEGSHRYQLSDG